MKHPKTLLRFVLGMGLALAATAVAAQAAELRVAVTANFTLPPLYAEPGTLSLGFDLAEPIPGVIAEGDTGFRVENISIDASFNGVAMNSTVNQAGWFAEPAFGYYGLDVRLSDVLVPSDRLQLILVTPLALYSGATSAPTLERLSLSDLGGGTYYYPTGFGAFTAEGQLSGATYEVSAVPEPAAALMLPLAMALIATVRRRSQRV